MAEGVFLRDLNLLELGVKVTTDSAGTHAYHLGKPPDKRGREAAQKRGVTIDALRARRIEIGDFSYFDFILAMDRQNLDMLRYLCPNEFRRALHLFSEFAPELNHCEIPDPYLGKSKDFEKALDLIELASRGLVDTIAKQFR